MKFYDLNVNDAVLAAERIRINLAEMGEGRHRRDIMGKVRRDEFRSRFVA
jgi:hypothetical protein